MSEPAGDETVERVIAALEEYQRLSLDVLESNGDDAEAAVRGLIGLHLDWTEANPETSRLISKHRHEVMSSPRAAELIDSNKRFFAEMKRWIERHAEAGRMPAMSFNLMHAVVFAPTQEIAKLGLAGRLGKPLGEYAGPLGDAAWAGLTALPDRQRPAPSAGS